MTDFSPHRNSLRSTDTELSHVLQGQRALMRAAGTKPCADGACGCVGKPPCSLLLAYLVLQLAAADSPTAGLKLTKLH